LADRRTPHARQPYFQTYQRAENHSWPGAHQRNQHPGRPARGTAGLAGGRRRASGRQDFHRTGQGTRAGPGSDGQPDPGPGADRHRQRRAGAADGGQERRAESGRRAAGDRADGRSAGRRQDHHRRQAVPAAERNPEKEDSGGFRRRVPPGRDRTAEDTGRTGRRRILPVVAGPEAAGHRRRGAGSRQTPPV